MLLLLLYIIQKVSVKNSTFKILKLILFFKEKQQKFIEMSNSKMLCKEQSYLQILESQGQTGNPKDILATCITSFRQESHIETLHLLQSLSKLSVSGSPLTDLIPFIGSNTKDLQALVCWVLIRNNSLTSYKWIFLIDLISRIQNSKQEIQNFFINQQKYFSKYTKQCWKIQSIPKSSYQCFLEQIQHKISIYQIRQIFRQVGIALAQIDLEKTVKCYTMYIQADYTNESKFLLGKALIDSGDFRGGNNFLNQIDYRNYHLDGLVLLAKVSYNIGDLRQSVRIYLHLIQIDNDKTSLSTLGHFEIANIFYDLFMHSKAIQRYKRSFQINQRRDDKEQSIYWKTAMLIVKIYRQNDENTTSICFLEKLVEQQNIPIKTEVELYYWLGSILKVTKNYSKSLYYYQKAYKIQSHEQILVYIGQIYFLLEQYDISCEYFNKTLQTKTKSKALIYLSLISLKLGRIEEAKNQLKQAQELSKSLTISNKQYYRQIVEEAYGKNDTSKEMIQISQRQISIAAKAFLGKGAQLRIAKNCSLSFTLLKISLQLDDKNRAYVFFQMGMILLLSQRLKECIQLFKESLNLKPDLTQALEMLFKVHHYLQRQQKWEYIKKIQQIDLQKASKLLQISQQSNFFAIDNQNYKKQMVDGVNLIMLPSRKLLQLKPIIDKINVAISKYLIHQKEESFEAFRAIFRTCYYDSYKLYTCAVNLITCDVSQVALIFYKRYFQLKPFDKEALKRCIGLIQQRFMKQNFNVTSRDISCIQSFLGAENLNADGEIYYELAKLSKQAKDRTKALNYSIQAFKNDLKDEYCKMLQAQFASLKYTEQEFLLRMVKIRNDYWSGHERLGKIYRRQGNKEKEVFHLEQVIKYSWSHQRPLERLLDIYKELSTQKYFQYMERLVKIQTTNTALLIEFAQIQGSRKNIQHQVEIYNQILRVNPQAPNLYSKVEQFFVKITKGKCVEQIFCYQIQQQIFDSRNLSNSLLLSVWYKHYNRMIQSFSCFMLAIQQLHSRKTIVSVKTKLKQAKQWLQRQIKNSSNKDAKLKLFVLMKLIGEANIQFIILQILFGSQMSAKKCQRAQIPIKVNQFYEECLRTYSSSQILFIMKFVLSESCRDITEVQACLSYICSQHPEVDKTSLISNQQVSQLYE